MESVITGDEKQQLFYDHRKLNEDKTLPFFVE